MLCESSLLACSKHRRAGGGGHAAFITSLLFGCAVGDGMWMKAGIAERQGRNDSAHVWGSAEPPLVEPINQGRFLRPRKLSTFPLRDQQPLFTACASTAMAEPMSYCDPHTPAHPKKSFESLFKRLTTREKKVPASNVPLTKRNLEEFHNPDYTDIHNAFLTVRPQRKVSIHEWLQLLP